MKLCDASWKKIEKETIARVELSQGRYFNGQGMHTAKSPAGWEHWKPSIVELRSRNLLTTHRDLMESTATATRSGVPSRTKTREEYNIDFSDALGALNLQSHGDIGNILAFDHDNEDSDPRDLTACDKECGYCGRCAYCGLVDGAATYVRIEAWN